MQRPSDIQSNIDRTIERRRRMASTIEQALKEAPQEMNELLQMVGKIYYSGSITRFWDVLAIIAGAERGFGNDWYFTILNLKKEQEEEKK